MRVKLKLRPGQRGTKTLTEEYGDKLICVRYRYDEAQHKRYKTVELIVDEVAWRPPVAKRDPEPLVQIQIDRQETSLQEAIQQIGGQGNPTRDLWQLPYKHVLALQLEGRIVEGVVPNPE